MIGKFAVAAVAGLLVAGPSLAVTTITFGDFRVTPTGARNVQYSNPTSGSATLTHLSPSGMTTKFSFGMTEVNAVFTLSATAVGSLTASGNQGTQLFNGSFSFKDGSTNLLTGSFTNASLVGTRGANSFTFNGNSVGGGMVNYSSDLPINFIMPNDFSFGITGLNRTIAFGSNGNFFAAGQTGAGSMTGNFSTAVPEPETWAMMILGFGMIGMAMRRRRTLRSVTA